jgi:DNA polymerase III delta prime subunit
MREEFLWVEKYRPHRIQDCVLPVNLKQTFQKFVDDKAIPNLLLSGGAGMGKTTVAKAMCDELDCDWYIINGSMSGNIDTLRNEIRNFAGTVSMLGGRKYVILDEADYLNPNSTQPALRNFMEEFSNNCGFVLTCNFKNRILQPIHSRCSVVEFKIPNKEKSVLASQFLDRSCDILTKENVEFDKKVVAEVIMKFFPDWRRVLNELQRYGASGAIDSGILAQVVDADIKDLVRALRDKDYKAMRTWVGVNSSIDHNTLYRKLYDMAHDMLKPDSIPNLVMILAEYQYKSAFVVDQEINTAACMTQIMVGCEFAK